MASENNPASLRSYGLPVYGGRVERGLPAPSGGVREVQKPPLPETGGQATQRFFSGLGFARAHRPRTTSNLSTAALLSGAHLLRVANPRAHLCEPRTGDA